MMYKMKGKRIHLLSELWQCILTFNHNSKPSYELEFGRSSLELKIGLVNKSKRKKRRKTRIKLLIDMKFFFN